MGTHGVVVALPCLERTACLGERGEQRLVQELVAQAAVEALDEGVLDGLAWSDVMPVDAGLAGPGQDGVAGQLRTVVAADGLGLAVDGDEQVELASHPFARQREVGDRDLAAPGANVGVRQNAEAAPAHQLIGDEVEHPQVVRQGRHRHWCARAHSPLAAAPLAHHQPFFAVEPEQPLVVHHEALAAQEDQKATVAEPAAFTGQRHKPLAQLGIVAPALTVAYRHALAADHPARPPLAHLMDALEVSHGLSLGSGRHHFFVSRSFNAALSSMASANSFFSLAFSPSSARSRLASDTSSPPYLLFQL